jgi:MSHA pilin protein MshC
MRAIPTKAHSGFTLVELVIVLVIIGVLAASVAPRILGRSGTDALTAQDQIISVLRLLQLQAMQQTEQTNPLFCKQVLITTTGLGLPDQNACTISSQFSASASVNSPTQFIGNTTSQVRLSVFLDTLGLTAALPPATEFRFRFNSKGQPVNDAATTNIYSSGLRIQATDGDTYGICIEDEGYIHPC